MVTTSYHFRINHQLLKKAYSNKTVSSFYFKSIPSSFSLKVLLLFSLHSASNPLLFYKPLHLPEEHKYVKHQKAFPNDTLLHQDFLYNN